MRYRGAKTWTLAQLAAASRIDEWTLRQLETGGIAPHAGHIQRLSMTFKCTAEDLMRPCKSQRNPQIARRKMLANLDKGRGAARWAGKLEIPKNASVLVRRLFEIMNENLLTITEVAEGTGVAIGTISDWRYRRSPSLSSFVAVLASLGYELEIKEVSESEDP